MFANNELVITKFSNKIQEIKMNKNVNSVDRLLRVVLGAAAIGVGFYFQNVWGAVGIIGVVTGMIGWCPAYTIFGISSCKVKQTA